MQSYGKNVSDDDDDSAPEIMSFNSAKSENLEQMQKIKDQILSIRESQKKKRIERQEKYIEQKKKKFADIKLSEDILHAIDIDETKEEKQDKKSTKKVNMNKIQKFSEDINETSLTDFMPLKTFTNFGISVVNLASTNKKALIASDKAKDFKQKMFNRNGLKRQSAQESLAITKKRKHVK